MATGYSNLNHDEINPESVCVCAAPLDAQTVLQLMTDLEHRRHAELWKTMQPSSGLPPVLQNTSQRSLISDRRALHPVQRVCT